MRSSQVPVPREDEWLWGWDATPGIVSVWAEPDGRAWVWRRERGVAAVRRDEESFSPWMLLSSLEDLMHLGERLAPEGRAAAPRAVTYRELAGPGGLSYGEADDRRFLSRLRAEDRRLVRR